MKRKGEMKMKQLYSEIEIHASAEIVWKHLTDFDKFPEWNSFMRIVGEPKQGERIQVLIQPSGTKGNTFYPKLVKVEPQRELRWIGRVLIPYLFDGEHIFEIKPIDEKRVLFIQRENFRGILVPFLSKMLDRDTKRGFEEMNQALKERAENDN
jgi:hypothetical protein